MSLGHVGVADCAVQYAREISYFWGNWNPTFGDREMSDHTVDLSAEELERLELQARQMRADYTAKLLRSLFRMPAKVAAAAPSGKLAPSR